MPQYEYSKRLIHRAIAFPPHAILSRMFYQLVFMGCWFITWQQILRSYHSYTSILSECWPACNSDSHGIFYKDWSGTSLTRTRQPELVGSSHRHQQGLASLVLSPRLDWSEYSDPCLWNQYVHFLMLRRVAFCYFRCLECWDWCPLVLKETWLFPHAHSPQLARVKFDHGCYLLRWDQYLSYLDVALLLSHDPTRQQTRAVVRQIPVSSVLGLTSSPPKSNFTILVPSLRSQWVPCTDMFHFCLPAPKATL